MLAARDEPQPFEVQRAADRPRAGWIPGWGSWLAFPIFVVSVWAFDNPDYVMAWLLSQKVIAESATLELSSTIANYSLAASLIGAIAAWRIAASGLYLSLRISKLSLVLLFTWVALLYRWLAPSLAASLQPVVTRVLESSVSRELSAGLRAARRASILLFQPLMSAAVAVYRYLLRRLALSRLVISAMLSAMSTAVTSAFRQFWTAIAVQALAFAHVTGLVLGYLWLACTIALIRVGRALGVILRYAWLGISGSLIALGNVVVLTLGYVWAGMSLAYRVLAHMVNSTLSLLRFGVSVVLLTIYRPLAVVLRYVWLMISTGLVAWGNVAAVTLGYIWASIAVVSFALAGTMNFAVRYVLLGSAIALRPLNRALAIVTHYTWLAIAGAYLVIVRAVSFLLGYLWLAVSALVLVIVRALTMTARYAWLVIAVAYRAFARAIGFLFGYLWIVVTALVLVIVGAVTMVARHAWLAVLTAYHLLANATGFILGSLWLGIGVILCALGKALMVVLAPLQSGMELAYLILSHVTSLVLGQAWRGAAIAVAALGRLFGRALRYWWFHFSTVSLGLTRPVASAFRYFWLTAGQAANYLLTMLKSTISFALRWILALLTTIFAIAMWPLQHPGEVPLMSLNLTRNRLLGLIVVIWLLVAGWVVLEPLRAPKIVITHWANGHMMNEPLLPTFSKQFNAAGYRTDSGKRIEVQPFIVNSGVITCQLIKRIEQGHCEENKGTGGEGGDDLDNPTIVTPAADHWLSLVNRNVGRTVIDVANMKPLATTYIGIATYTDMAQCLGWPNTEIGFADIVTLASDPAGWRSKPCAKAEWGEQPLVSFTDPSSSSTGRTMLYTFYSIGAGVSLEQLTQSHVSDTSTVAYVKSLQDAVDHYVPDTLILNTKIYLGPSYGHFYFIAEDNLVKLHQGKVKVTEGGKTEAKRLTRDMVMIYPKEGSPTHNHSAGIVQADWVTPEHRDAADKWVSFLLEDAQQQSFMEEGFRPGYSDVAYVKPTGSRFTPDPAKPAIKLNPDRIDPAAAEAIAASWGEVKKSGVVTFVLDTSGSMSGNKLDQAKSGLVRALDNIHNRNLVGLVTFSDGINQRSQVQPITESRYAVASLVRTQQAGGQTALYEAIAEAVRMTDDAPAARDAIRGVVVLTDGQANKGRDLASVVKMRSRQTEQAITCGGMSVESSCLNGAYGEQLAIETVHRIHVFVVGIGDADLEVCRILAEATASACQGTTEKDLAAVLEQFGRYF